MIYAKREEEDRKQAQLKINQQKQRNFQQEKSKFTSFSLFQKTENMTFPGMDKVGLFFMKTSQKD